MVTKSKSRNDSITSDCEVLDEFASNAHNIDYSIYKNCQRSKLKIVFMHKNDLRKWRSQYNQQRSYEPPPPPVSSASSSSLNSSRVQPALKSFHRLSNKHNNTITTSTNRCYNQNKSESYIPYMFSKLYCCLY